MPPSSPFALARNSALGLRPITRPPVRSGLPPIASTTRTTCRPKRVPKEPLCWGWINSVPRALDADRSMILIAPRNPASAWSAVNKAFVDKARASGAMTPAGEAKIITASANGMWDFLTDVDALIDPPDLTGALAATGTADFWEAQPRSIRRGALEWIKTAKAPATRAKRIKDVTDSAAQGLRPSPFRR